MTTPDSRTAPAGNQGHSEQLSTNNISEPSLPDPVGETTARAAVDGVYVAVVHTKTVDGNPRWSRRIFLTLQSAQKTVDRAHMRGQRAYVVLCQLRAATPGTWAEMGGDA